MPLHDSLSSSQVVRLPKNSSIPTTEDLKYALAEANKHKGLKSVELPFKNPSNNLNFVVKLSLGQKANAAPTWSLQRGDGIGGKLLWTRHSEDVLMIQNKIKIDSQSTGEGEAAMQAEHDSEQEGGRRKRTQSMSGFETGQQEPIILGGAPTSSPPIILGGAPSSSQPIVLGGSPTPGMSLPTSPPPPAPAGPPASMFQHTQEMEGPAPATLDIFFSPNYPPPLDAFVSAQPPGSMVPEPTAPPEPAKPKRPPTPLPQPIKFDKNVLNEVHRQLSDPVSGLMKFPAFVFFLFREFVRFQKTQVPYSVVILEVAVRKGPQVAALPPQAIPRIAERVRSVLSPLDIGAHLSGGEFGFIVASTDGVGALDFAVNLHEALTNEPLVPGGDEAVLVAIGAASIPDTCNHPEVLVAAARQAKDMTKGASKPYLLFPSES